MPANSGVFKPFRQVVRDTLSAAVKEKNDEAFQYATSVEAPVAVVADFDKPGRFARLDALLLLEIERIAKGHGIGDAVTAMQDELGLQEPKQRLRGRQALFILYKWFQTEDESGLV